MSDLIVNTFYPISSKVFDNDNEKVDLMLTQAHKKESIEDYYAKAFGYGIITSVVTAFFMMLLSVSLFIFAFDVQSFVGTSLPVGIILVMLFTLSGLLIGYGIGHYGTYIMLTFAVDSYSRNIEALLPDSINYMKALASGGANELEILRAIAEDDSPEDEKTYGKVAEEFQTIINDMEYFGLDYRNAVRKRARETPSEDLDRFLTDFLTIIDTGGDIETFLQDQQDRFVEEIRRSQEKELEMLDLLAQMYMTLSIFPAMAIILLVIMQIVQGGFGLFIPAVIYLLIPILGVSFILLAGIFTSDEYGSSRLGEDTEEESLFSADGFSNRNDSLDVVSSMKDIETKRKRLRVFTSPKAILREKPALIFTLTIPITLFAIVGFLVTGIAPAGLGEFKSNKIIGSAIFAIFPTSFNFGAYYIFYRMDKKKKSGITGNLSSSLRRMASTNETGQTLLQSMRIVGENDQTKFGDELIEIYNKVEYGKPMKIALYEFSNKYEIPRLARTMKLVAKAQETSSNVSGVLRHASETNKMFDDMEKERANRTMANVAIIFISFLLILGIFLVIDGIFLGEVALQIQNIETPDSAGAGAGDFGNSDFDIELLSMYLFHGALINGVVASFVAGYIRTGEIAAGAKWMAIVPPLTLLIWGAGSLLI